MWTAVRLIRTGGFARVPELAAPPHAGREDHPDPPDRRLAIPGGPRSAARFAAR
ncbi:MAG: hypothetical protein IOC92_02085 [Rhodobacter sp.]|nr:hypothetical protein [Rhodobacter sp.]MCA3468143.1 hypothetical protein [Rhodobacter sp.]MCA3474578.1 hypothetical protein [Rhodobacter sp.]MCA3480823.1 hypothetical protein [Rhodobacter sp.]MCA3482708.1 hypothetical protein [Rhodobacter sp.]